MRSFAHNRFRWRAQEGSHVKDTPDSKISPPPKAEIANPRDVQASLVRAKRILLIYMPTPSKMVH